MSSPFRFLKFRDTEFDGQSGWSVRETAVSRARLRAAGGLLWAEIAVAIPEDARSLATEPTARWWKRACPRRLRLESFPPVPSPGGDGVRHPAAVSGLIDGVVTADVFEDSHGGWLRVRIHGARTALGKAERALPAIARAVEALAFSA